MLHALLVSKVKMSHCRHAGAKGERTEAYSSYSFLTSALHGVSGQYHAPAVLYPQESTPVTHWIGGLLGLRAGLDTEAKLQSFATDEDRSTVVQTVHTLYTD
jgi:hypothetical protein